MKNFGSQLSSGLVSSNKLSRSCPSSRLVVLFRPVSGPLLIIVHGCPEEPCSFSWQTENVHFQGFLTSRTDQDILPSHRQCWSLCSTVPWWLRAKLCCKEHTMQQISRKRSIGQWERKTTSVKERERQREGGQRNRETERDRETERATDRDTERRRENERDGQRD